MPIPSLALFGSLLLLSAFTPAPVSGALSTSAAYEKMVSSAACGRVHEWSSDCVKEFMLHCGFPLTVLAGVQNAGLTGSILLELNADDYAILGIDLEIDKKRWAAVDKELHTAINAGSGTTKDGSSTDLYELRGANRAGFSRAMTFVLTFPRLSTLYYQMYAHEGNPLLMFDTVHERSTFSWFWWIVFPEKMIADHFGTFTDTNYWRATMLVFTAYLTGIAALLSYAKKLTAKNLVNGVFMETIGAAVGYLVWSYILWPLTPRFFCDFVFYIEPFMIIVGAFVGFFVGLGAASLNDKRY